MAGMSDLTGKNVMAGLGCVDLRFFSALICGKNIDPDLPKKKICYFQ
jgi:hypothetical protein